MSARPIIVPMAILSALVLGCAAPPPGEPPFRQAPQARIELPPLSGSNTISAIEVHRDPNGRWSATFDYFFTGDPPWAELIVAAVRPRAGQSDPALLNVMSGRKLAERGAHRVTLEIDRPSHPDALTTTEVLAQLRGPKELIVSQRLIKTIEWPNWRTWALERELEGKSAEEILAKAVALIDAGDRYSLNDAKPLLERLIRNDSQFDPVYVDQHDNYKLNALAYALRNKNHSAARRLLRFGAQPLALIGPGEMPVALLPVMALDFEGIRLMRQFGVDYTKVRYEGITAVDHAKRMGNRRLLEALDPKGRSL